MSVARPPAAWALALLLVLPACSDRSADASTTTTGASTSSGGAADTTQGSTGTTEASTGTAGTPPTTAGEPGGVPSGDTGVVVAEEGVLGWFDGTKWVQAQTSAPLDGDERFQVFRLGEEPAEATAVGLDRGCPVFEEGVGVRFADDPWPQFDPFAPRGIAVSSGWDAAPHPLTEEPPTGAQLDAVTELLASREIDDPQPDLIQLVSADVDGDGAREAFGVAERRTGEEGVLNPAPAGDYSIAFVVLESGETAVLGEWVVVEHDEPGFIQDLVVFRIDALADADGDGVDEVALRASYYEGSGVSLLDWQGDDAGWVEVVSAACGA